MTHLSGGAIFGIVVAAIVIIPAWLSLAIRLTVKIFEHDRQREGRRFLPQSDPGRSVVAFWLFLLMFAVSPVVAACAILAPCVLLAVAIVLGIAALVAWIVGGTIHILGFYVCCCFLRGRKRASLHEEEGQPREDAGEINGNGVDNEVEVPRIPPPPYQANPKDATTGLPPGYETFSSTARRPVPRQGSVSEDALTSTRQAATQS